MGGAHVILRIISAIVLAANVAIFVWCAFAWRAIIKRAVREAPERYLGVRQSEKLPNIEL
jgi:hypothetical protein